MSELLTFVADAAVISRLGRELVAKQETALIELIKNSFDADATRVDVVFSEAELGPVLEVRDNGTGMSRQELVDGFMRLASDLKVQSPLSSRYQRQRAGRKGIGRFATQRLGDRLVLITRRSDQPRALRLNVDWTQFTSGRELTQIQVHLDEVDVPDVGTVLRIERLCDEWTDAQIRRCWRGVLGLQQPFPVRPIEAAPNADPGFNVRFLRRDALIEDETVVANLQTEILDHLHAVIELRVDEDGVARWRISKNRFGEVRDWQPIHHEHLDDGGVVAYEHLRDVAMKAHYAILAPNLLPSLVFTRVRDELAEFGGIRLYRNGFRVVPYGDAGNDWLRLDEMYSKRSTLSPIANRNFFGLVEVHDPEGRMYEEHTSREGLIETPAFHELRELVSSVLVTASTRIAEDRGRKTHAGGPRRQLASAQEVLSKASDAIRAAQQAAEQAAQGGEPIAAAQVAATQAQEAARLVEMTRVQVASEEDALADESSMLRFLATLGMTTAEFSHETGMTFDAFRLDFQAVFSATSILAIGNPVLEAQAKRAEGMLARLDTLTSYLNALAAARSARGIAAVSLSRAVEQFARGVELQARSQGIELEIETPPFDALFTRPMHEAEVASLLLNFYTNAVKAIKRAKGPRRIRIVADRISDAGRVRLRVYDTGDGIPEENRERIFDAFFTTSAAPPAGAEDVKHATGTGLGLWIVSQIVMNAGGEILAGPGIVGFMTCMEVQLPAEQDDER